ncbi:MAG: hypothetical protein M3264_00795 [Thermoproteota archaeon]|nr:hypothetical protein [Thermoproteota archaeon]
MTINVVRKSTTRFISPSGSLSFVSAFIDYHHTLIFALIGSSPLSGSYNPDVAEKVITFKSNLQHSTSATIAATGLIRVS